MASYSEILDKIYRLRGGVIDLRLERMERALELFDHPETNYPALHIAGTNGKGSTAAMLHSVLCRAGYRAGLYTSPHLVSFTERIRVADEAIAPDQVVALAEEIMRRTSAADVPLTFFEFVTVMALLHFARHQVEVAVIEVGLGGRLDATNLVRPVVSVITTISKDHEAYLGSDLASIAREKGGIIKQAVPAIAGDLPEAALSVIEQIAAARGAKLHCLKRDFDFFLKSDDRFDYNGLNWRLADLRIALRGRHQRSNAAVALCALEVTQGAFPVTESAVREGLEAVVWPGRFETFGSGPTVVLDGAHNGEGARALAATIEEFRGGRNVKLLFASMEDKDWGAMLDILSPSSSEIVLTRVAMERSADPERLAAYLRGKAPHRVIQNPRDALAALVRAAAADDLIVVAGSLYLLGEVRPAVQELTG